jgi:hypothetical protein
MSPRYLACLAALLTACDRPAPEGAPSGTAPLREPTGAAAPAKPAKPADKPVLAVTELRADQLPPGIPHGNDVLIGRRWRDQLGDNVFLLTRSGRESCADDICGTTVTMNGYHYLLSGGSSTLLWRTTDQVETCELDLTLDPHPRAVSVTDLDADGTAETTYVYAMACRGDVSPLDMKLIMHEGAAKFAIRGSTRMSARMLPPDGLAGGMEVDAAFSQAPPEFRAFAVSHWNQFNDYERWSVEDMEGEDHTGH